MPVTESEGEGTLAEARAAVQAQRRTLRMLAEATREVARSTLRGEEMGLAAIPYALLGLDRAIQASFGSETLRTRHQEILREMELLVAGGVQEAVTVARRLHAVTSLLLAVLNDPEEVTDSRRPS